MAQQNNPFADAFQAFDAFKAQPAVDFNEAIAQSKRNLEAAQEAVQVWVEGGQQIISLQTKIAEQNAKNMLELFNAIAASKDPQESTNKQAEYAQDVIEKASSDAKQITDIAIKTNNKANDLIKAQVAKNIKEISKAASAAAAKATSATKKAAA